MIDYMKGRTLGMIDSMKGVGSIVVYNPPN